LKTSIKTITNLSDTNCLEIQGASLLEAINLLFKASTGEFVKPTDQEHESKLKAIVQRMEQQYGNDLQMFTNPTAPDADREKICDMSIDMYTQILTLSPKDAGAILRSMLAGE
ncbi:hypothetical protein LH411_23050, partial [Yersinia intermedia]|nr:hypothetical protein [Yersinia intermedia]